MSRRRYALAPSTALMAVTALAEVADSEVASAETIRAFCDDILTRISHQPDTVLHLSADEVLAMRDEIVANSDTWAPSPDEA